MVWKVMNAVVMLSVGYYLNFLWIFSTISSYFLFFLYWFCLNYSYFPFLWLGVVEKS